MISLPIIVLENGDLNLFASVEDLGGYLEAVDVRDGRFVAYDAAGNRLRLTIEGRSRVGVREDPGALGDPESLAQALRRCLAAGPQEVPAEAGLDELVRLAIDRVGFR